MEFKDEYEKIAYYSKYISGLMAIAGEVGDRKPSLVMYASSDGETYDPSVEDPYSDEYFVTSDDFAIKITDELVEWAKSGEMDKAKLSEELKLFIERVRSSAPEEWLESYPNE